MSTKQLTVFDNAEKFLTPEEAGAVFGLTGSFIRRHTVRGVEPRLKYYRVSNRIRLKLSDLHDFAQAVTEKQV